MRTRPRTGPVVMVTSAGKSPQLNLNEQFASTPKVRPAENPNFRQSNLALLRCTPGCSLIGRNIQMFAER